MSPDKEQALADRMAALGIREEDIVEKFIRSGGHGGQNVNKVATCVYLKHLPDRHRGQVPAGALPVPQPLPGPPHPDRQDRGGRPGQAERGGAADRQDPPPEEEALETGQGEDAGRQAPCLGDQEGPFLQARPARRVSPARLSRRYTLAGG
ncbi:MAG: peptide chain release factor-like protein [Ignavibacteriales bacterium]|nr:peptide chain release factor-like protein [Ignavibacteriales bacterium]